MRVSTASDAGQARVEHDLLGPVEVPAAAYWGAHTARAVANFQISGTAISSWPELIGALAAVKEAAARANRDLGQLPAELAQAIIEACGEIRAGLLREQFVVDVFQGGAGTSTNMNVNEVIANRALELLGHGKGEYDRLHPNDHVNRSQSTNDVYPTALRIALLDNLPSLTTSLEELRRALAAKAAEFAEVPKLGRTQLQDAVPMTAGQELGAIAAVIGHGLRRLAAVRPDLEAVNLGATAIGTGITAPAGYGEVAVRHLREVTHHPLTLAPDLISATWDCGPLVTLSGVLKSIAVDLSKICNDLRLLSSGPRAGFAELQLPARQAGSSLMPGKVNPVIPEVVNQVAFQVIGHDLTITLAAEAGQLQLNAFQPLIAFALSTNIRHLERACRALAGQCVQDLTADSERMQRNVADSLSLATALTPLLGYARATAVAKEALATGLPVPDLVRRRDLLTEPQLQAALAFVGVMPRPGSSPR